MKKLLIENNLSSELSPLNKYEDYEKLTLGSGRKLYWICVVCGLEWHASVNSRSRGSGCPECSKLKKNYSNNNYLWVVSEELYRELDFVKNNGVEFRRIMAGSDAEYYWLCKDYGHSFKARVGRRVKYGYKCPICSGRKLLSGFNDLKTYSITHGLEYLLEEYSKVNSVTPDEVYYKSSKKFIWRCSGCLNEWDCQVNYRTMLGVGCAKCSKRRSRGEGELGLLLKDFNVEFMENNRSLIKPLEVDFYIPSLRIAIEYNGDYWHGEEYLFNSRNMSSESYHRNKFEKCLEVGVELLFVWEHDWRNHHSLVVASLLDKLDGVDGDYSLFKRFSNIEQCFLSGG